MEVTSENVRKIEEQHGSQAWGNTPLQAFTVVFAWSKPASETGFAIRGREKNSPRREAVNIPRRYQHGEKGEGGGNVFFHFISFRISQLP